MRRRESSTFFTSKGLAFALSSGGPGRPGEPKATRRWGLHATLVGARDGALVPEVQQSATVHDCVGPKAAWSTDMPTFGRIAWEEIYPGIDMVAEPSRGGVSYQFVLSPGAKVADIALRWEGATGVKLTDDARGVDVETGIGVLRVRGLRAFAVEGAQRTELAARHVMHGSDVAVEVDGWDGRSALVIDPMIAWSSYLGGTQTDEGDGIAVDGSGNAFVTGSTISADFPTTGGFDTTAPGGWDAFVTKVSAAGTLAWSSYLGGTNKDFGVAIAVDGSGNVFTTGYTQSSNFPASGGFDTTYEGGGAEDAFVTKLSGAGTLLWSSFLGGGAGASDYGLAIAVDGSGNALVTGATRSSDFPTTGGFQKTRGGLGDAFVTKVSGAGALVWSSYLGGSQDEYGYGIAADSSGNVFVTGSTLSANFPTSGGFDTAFGGVQDAFVAKVSGAGTLAWSSFLGGAGDPSSSTGTTANAIAVDSTGNAFVTGTTDAAGFPTTGGFDTTADGAHDAFVTKVSGAGTLAWSSYLGGATDDVAHGVAVDGSGNVYIAGHTDSTDFPTSGGFDKTEAGGDAFVTKVSGAGGAGALVWSSLLGGTLDEVANGIAVDTAGNVLVVGKTVSTDFPVSGGFDTSLGGYGDAFVTKIRQGVSGCTTAADCTSGFCVDGVCCNTSCTGKCQACSAAKKGSGADGTCGPIADGTDPDKECPQNTCTGSTETNAQVCNGAGACRTNGTTACTPFACSGSACATSCTTDAQCDASAYCSSGVCVADLAAGASCTRNEQCAGNFCVDGVCCDKACAGSCEACSAAMKGSGSDGVCGNVAAGTDPRDKCAADSTPDSCKADGMCDGAGACRVNAPKGTACGATTCTAGTVSGMTCNGAGMCETGTASCAPFVCGATACKTTCASDPDCAADAYCTTSGVCATKSKNGVACSAARECENGLCVDGVCCASACTGQCESCNEMGTEGTCVPVSGAPRGKRPACAGDPAVCGGTCDGTNPSACTLAPSTDKTCATTGGPAPTADAGGCATSPGRTRGSGALTLAALAGLSMLARRRRAA